MPLHSCQSLARQGLAAETIQRKLSAVASLYDNPYNENLIETNPVAGVKRPSVSSNEEKTPALSDAQARKLPQAPPGPSLKVKRDRAILAAYPFSTSDDRNWAISSSEARRTSRSPPLTLTTGKLCIQVMALSDCSRRHSQNAEGGLIGHEQARHA